MRIPPQLYLLLIPLGCGMDAASPVAPEPPPAATGRLVIGITTAGSDLDPDGYQLLISPAGRTERTAVNDTVRLTALASGNHTVQLSGVSLNCLPNPDAVRTVAVQADTETAIGWDITCYRDAWRSQNVGTVRQLRVHFTGARTGFASARGTSPGFWATEDGGTTWSRRADVPAAADVGALFYMRDVQHAFVAGADTWLARTADGGRSWTAQRLLTAGNYILSMYFVDAQHGWLSGDGPWVFRTRDGGVTWQQIDMEFYGPKFGLFFADTLRGVMTGSGGNAFTSADGGRTWTARSTGTTRHLQSMSFMNDSVGVAVGDDGVIIRTTNRGLSWSRATSPSSTQLWGVDLSPSGFGVAVGDGGTILVTRNGGLSWEKEFTSATTTLVHPSVLTEQDAWIGGLGGTLLRRLAQ